MDINELRNSFLFSETVTQRIRGYVRERIENIQANETPIILSNYPKIVIHIIPLSSLDSQKVLLSLEVLKQGKIFPLGADGYDERYNLDGVLKFDNDRESKIGTAYAQLYRNGLFESVNTEYLGYSFSEEKKIIPCSESSNFSFEYQVLKTLFDYLKFLKQNSFEPPIYCFLTFIGVKEYTIGISDDRYSFYRQNTIDRDILTLPEILIQTYEDNIVEHVRGWCDIVWNASGYSKSFSFDKNPYIQNFIQSNSLV